MNADEEDDEREFAPAEEIVYRMDLVIDALDVIERIIANSDDLVIPDADRRQMKASNAIAERIEVTECYAFGWAPESSEMRITRWGDGIR
jgi:hypothetical protein